MSNYRFFIYRFSCFQLTLCRRSTSSPRMAAFRCLYLVAFATFFVASRQVDASVLPATATSRTEKDLHAKERSENAVHEKTFDEDGKVQGWLSVGTEETSPEAQPLSVYGQFGFNYFTDNGKAYINCAKSGSIGGSHQLGNVSDGTATTVKCFVDPQKPRERPGCMAVFMYGGSKEQFESDKQSASQELKITAQDCWQHEEEVVNACALSDKCVYKYDVKFGEVMFCCCNTHNCNDAVYLRSDFPKRFPNVTLNEGGTTSEVHEVPTQPNYAWMIVIASICLFILAAIVALLCCYRICMHESQHKQQLSSCYHSTESNALIVNKKSPPGMTVDTHTLDIHDMISVAQGRFGKVYKAVLRGSNGRERTVAVKVFPINNVDSFIGERDIYNIPSIRNCSHGSILKYIGCDVRRERDEHWLVTEYHEYGNLHEYLKANVVTVAQAKRLLISMLDGISFLHEERIIDAEYKPTIVHRDIKSRNVLLRMDEHHHLYSCIADFGLALRCDGGTVIETNQHGQVGTRRYMSPEVLEGATEFTVSAFRQIDVYATALVMWEVMSRVQLDAGDLPAPYQLPYEMEVGLSPSLGDLRDTVVAQKKRPQFRQQLMMHSDARSMCVTAEEMWDGEAEGRITAGCALERLRQLCGEESEGYCSGSEPRCESSAARLYPHFTEKSLSLNGFNREMHEFEMQRTGGARQEVRHTT